MISKLYAKHKVPSAKNTDFDSFHHSPPLKSHHFGLRDKIFSMYVESDLRKMKNKRFWDKISFLMSFGTVFSKRAIGAQKLQFREWKHIVWHVDTI